MGAWIGNAWHWQLQWSRELREVEISHCQDPYSVIREVKLKKNEANKLCWGHRGKGQYSVKKAYQLLSGSTSNSSVCKPKAKGGLGVKDMGSMNKALLGKWICQLLTETMGLLRQ
ncbi:hypothetical protein Ancab_017020, partial [Ancistrocladus abbreviatus]